MDKNIVIVIIKETNMNKEEITDQFLIKCLKGPVTTADLKLIPKDSYMKVR